MRVLIWLAEHTWRSTVAQAAAILSADAEVTLLCVAAGDAVDVVQSSRAGLLGRAPPPPPAAGPELESISEEAAQALLGDAQRELGRPAARVIRHGRVEREVLAAAEHHDLLVMARDGDCAQPGPKSIGPQARFAIDHAPCRVLLLWPDRPQHGGTVATRRRQ